MQIGPSRGRWYGNDPAHRRPQSRSGYWQLALFGRTGAAASCLMKIGRNVPCPCGSGKKYKRCCLRADEHPASTDAPAVLPEAVRRAFAAMQQSEVKRLAKHGYVRPPIAAHFQGHQFVAVDDGGRTYDTTALPWFSPTEIVRMLRL